MLTIRRVSVAVAMLACLAIPLGGCGKKGDPTPVEMKEIRRLAALKLEKKPGSVFIRWPSGDPEGRHALFKLERSEWDTREEEDCPSCPGMFETIAEIDAEGPLCRNNELRECLYADDSAKAGYRYRYRLSICDERGMCDTYAPAADITY